MKEIIISTQKQLDELKEVKAGENVTITAALRLPGILYVRGCLVIQKPLDGDWNENRFVRASGTATVRASGTATIEAYDSSTIEACGSATIEAWDSATVEACGSATVRASGTATVRASGSATIEAYDSSTIEACGSATIEAWDSATVEACGSATVRASGSATVRASGTATVRAWDSATVEACGTATVRAWGSATVRASGSATIEACGSATVRASGTATVRAWDSATVEACGTATVRAWGSATVKAYDSSTVRLLGFSIGIGLPLFKFKIESDFAKVVIREQVFKVKKKTIVYKKLRDDRIATLELKRGQEFQSENQSKCRTGSAKVLKIEGPDGKNYKTGKSMHEVNFMYKVGETVSAPYDPEIKECSTGIHFFLDRDSAERYA
jgi:hypothetical protein